MQLKDRQYSYYNVFKSRASYNLLDNPLAAPYIEFTLFMPQ